MEYKTVRGRVDGLQVQNPHDLDSIINAAAAQGWKVVSSGGVPGMDGSGFAVLGRPKK